MMSKKEDPQAGAKAKFEAFRTLARGIAQELNVAPTAVEFALKGRPGQKLAPHELGFVQSRATAAGYRM